MTDVHSWSDRPHPAEDPTPDEAPPGGGPFSARSWSALPSPTRRQRLLTARLPTHQAAVLRSETTNAATIFPEALGTGASAGAGR